MDIQKIMLKKLISELSGEGFKHLRESQGLSQEKIAGIIGVSARTYVRWEHGQTKPTNIARSRLIELYRDVFLNDPYYTGHKTGKVLIAPTYDNIEGPLIFLAGPIQGAYEWQDQAVQIIHSLDSKLNIANPRRKTRAKGEFTQDMYNEQVDWETHYLRRAGEHGVVMFWLAKEFEEPLKVEGVPRRAYAQTSRFELAEWKVRHERDGSNLVVGVEEGFTGWRYIRRRLPQDCPEVCILPTLEETCQKAVELAYRKYDREFGRSLMEKYLGEEKQKRKYEHSKQMGEFTYKVALRIKERNPELNIGPEFVGFLGYVHDIGFFRDAKMHELHTIDLLIDEEYVPLRLAQKAMHGQLIEQYGEKDGRTKEYTPKGVEGMILTYADMTINTGPMAIDDRAAEIIGKVKGSDFLSEELRQDIVNGMHKALPRFHRYEQVVLALAGAESFADF